MVYAFTIYNNNRHHSESFFYLFIPLPSHHPGVVAKEAALCAQDDALKAVKWRLILVPRWDPLESSYLSYLGGQQGNHGEPVQVISIFLGDTQCLMFFVIHVG